MRLRPFHLRLLGAEPVKPKRAADVVCNAVRVTQTATGEREEGCEAESVAARRGPYKKLEAA